MKTIPSPSKPYLSPSRSRPQQAQLPGPRPSSPSQETFTSSSISDTRDHALMSILQFIFYFTAVVVPIAATRSIDTWEQRPPSCADDG